MASNDGDGVTFAERYPDAPEVPHGNCRNAARGQELHDARMAEFAAMPRCRCGLLLPCNDCLPATLDVFMAERMRTGGLEAPDAPTLTAAELHAPRTKWLREHDEGAGYGSHRATYGRKENR